MENKTTLVIHPHDASTDFLKKIYKDKDWTIINERSNEISKSKTRRLIVKHDRVIMMGHGGEDGLYFSHIKSNMVDVLRDKETVCIWCHADKFVQRYGLTGFFTGMLISEVSEANYFGIITSQEDVMISNQLFVQLVAKNIDNTPLYLQTILKESYKSTCPVRL